MRMCKSIYRIGAMVTNPTPFSWVDAEMPANIFTLHQITWWTLIRQTIINSLDRQVRPMRHFKTLGYSIYRKLFLQAKFLLENGLDCATECLKNMATRAMIPAIQCFTVNQHQATRLSYPTFVQPSSPFCSITTTVAMSIHRQASTTPNVLIHWKTNSNRLLPWCQIAICSNLYNNLLKRSSWANLILFYVNYLRRCTSVTTIRPATTNTTPKRPTNTMPFVILVAFGRWYRATRILQV